MTALIYGFAQSLADHLVCRPDLVIDLCKVPGDLPVLPNYVRSWVRNKPAIGGRGFISKVVAVDHRVVGVRKQPEPNSSRRLRPDPINHCL